MGEIWQADCDKAPFKAFQGVRSQLDLLRIEVKTSPLEEDLRDLGQRDAMDEDEGRLTPFQYFEREVHRESFFVCSPAAGIRRSFNPCMGASKPAA